MKINNYKSQKGNVLFLILIAVALFAALSYAVTQSSRSGGDASRETNVINTSSLTQYPNQVRTAVLRLVIAGTDPSSLQFNSPDEFDTATYTKFIKARGVFHVDGGAASWQNVPAKLHANAGDTNWIYSMAFRVPGLGTDNTDGTGNELIAFADDLTDTMCSRLNQDLGWGSSIPVLSSAVTITDVRDAAHRIAVAADLASPSSDGVFPNMTVASPVAADWMKNKAFGCFRNASGGHNVFYYTLVER